MGRQVHKHAERHAGENRNGDLTRQSKDGLRPGDVTWVKLRNNSWWPAQVAQENAVGDSAKPRKRRSGEILVRLYGTCEYSYVDPAGRQMKFENVLKKHKGNQREIFEKALKQVDFFESQSATSEKRSAKVKGETKAENGCTVKEKATPRKGGGDTNKKDETKKKIRPDSSSADITPGKSRGSARRLKVMQGLGLTAPSGSPFKRS